MQGAKMEKYPRGSEWRKWDLHFHTPSSSICYKNKLVTNEDIINKLVSENIKVVVITDHHIIDIERIRELQDLSKSKNLTVLPGIEFLSDARGSEPIHFIGIFAEDSNLDHIWGQLSNKTNISKVIGEGKKTNEIYCDLADTIKLISELGGVVSIHAGDKTNSIENITHSLPHTTAQKTDIAKIVDIYELGKEKDQKGYREIVFPAIGVEIPMAICSDNHDINDYKLKQNLWVKADPNFSGLKQALNEPSARFFIGEIPQALERINLNKTKYISELSIDTVPGKINPSQVWFNSIRIPLNNELVAIIGNKGSGKSAISDIIGLCADAEHSTDFLFLHKDKFNKKGFAERFEASITYESGTKTDPVPLNHTISSSAARKVQYLPQRYFETVCNEIGKVESFRKEIEKVVFQYIPEEKKLKKNSFDELISFKKESIEIEIADFVSQITTINKQIILLEDKKNPEYKNSLESKKTQKVEELRVHNESMPQAVNNPATAAETDEARAQREELQELVDKHNECVSQISVIENSVNDATVALEGMKQIKRDFEGKVKEVQLFIASRKKLASNVGIDLDKVLRLDFNTEPIDDLITKNEQTIVELKKNLGTEELPVDVEYDKLNLRSKAKFCYNQISLRKLKLSGAQQNYQKYLDNKKIWETKKAEIEGSVETPGSLAFIINELSYIDNQLAQEIENQREEQLKLSMLIHKAKREIKAFYDDIKSEIDKQLTECHVPNLTIGSSFALSSDFIDSLFNYIRQNRIGSFYGPDGKSLFFNKILSKIDWEVESSVESFFRSIIEYLENDKRDSDPSKHKPVFIGDLITKRPEFYSYLFSLSYLNAHYGLQQNNKNLEQLSPGEKGALLLVFYLVLDKEDIPLVIDQPEDNLDNHSVAKILVPFIREAKKHRQIIMVTHNPNLAVVADAEQIIRVNIDKENGNSFVFSSGSIENNNINKEIVDVLEGTMPAFSIRKNKYHDIS